MQAGLGLTDADRARSECPKGYKDVESWIDSDIVPRSVQVLVATSMKQLSMTCSIVRGVGACVLLKPINVLPNTESMEQAHTIAGGAP